jgi:hypothetical protein
MSMITKMLKQKAYRWERTGVDSFGQPMFAAPVLINCRWTAETALLLNKDGEQRTTSSLVYVDRDVPEGDMLGLESVLASSEQEAQSFDVALAAGDTGADVVFPTAYTHAPLGIFCKVISPDGTTFSTSPVYSTLTKLGVSVTFDAEVPSSGYILRVQVRNGFIVGLPVGASRVEVKFPLPYTSTPSKVLVQLALPRGGVSFGLAVSAITAEGFTVVLGAEVPGRDYRLYVQVDTASPTDYQETDVDLVSGSESIDIVFTEEFDEIPTGLFVRLNKPSDGVDFLLAPVLESITTLGATIRFDTPVPDEGYSITIQARSDYKGFKTDLIEGDEEVEVGLPNIFESTPDILTQLAVPAEGTVFGATAENISNSGFKAVLSGPIPSYGYALLTQLDIDDPEAELVVSYVDPRTIEGVHEVVRFSVSPNFKATEFLRACNL